FLDAHLVADVADAGDVGAARVVSRQTRGRSCAPPSPRSARKPVTLQLPEPSAEDVADVAERTARRIQQLLEKLGLRPDPALCASEDEQRQLWEAAASPRSRASRAQILSATADIVSNGLTPTLPGRTAPSATYKQAEAAGRDRDVL